jgi:hypothetical protein
MVSNDVWRSSLASARPHLPSNNCAEKRAPCCEKNQPRGYDKSACRGYWPICVPKSSFKLRRASFSDKVAHRHVQSTGVLTGHARVVVNRSGDSCKTVRRETRAEYRFADQIASRARYGLLPDESFPPECRLQIKGADCGGSRTSQEHCRECSKFHGCASGSFARRLTTG